MPTTESPTLDMQLRATWAIPSLGLRKGQMLDLHLVADNMPPNFMAISEHVRTGALVGAGPGMNLDHLGRFMDALLDGAR